VVELAGLGDLTPAVVSGLELAVSEIVTNAIVHGVAPVTLQAWLTSPSCVVVAVRDAGPGPSRPTNGSLPPGDALDGGRGMWICRRSVARVDAWVDIDGYVVQLTASV
jgi:anti-sigma regulatory factor (Ser/Thr protein kinase)